MTARLITHNHKCADNKDSQPDNRFDGMADSVPIAIANPNSESMKMSRQLMDVIVSPSASAGIARHLPSSRTLSSVISTS